MSARPVRMEVSRAFPVDRAIAFDYVTEPGNWPTFWPDLVGIPDLEGAAWRVPGDTIRLQMRLAGRLTDLHMTLDRLNRPAFVGYHTAQRGIPDATHERHFEVAPGGFRFRLVVSFSPRARLAGLVDRTVVRYAVRRALRRTLDNLGRVLA